MWGPEWIQVIREACSDQIAKMRADFVQGGLDFVGNFEIWKRKTKPNEPIVIQLEKELPLVDMRPRPDLLPWLSTNEGIVRVQIMLNT